MRRIATTLAVVALLFSGESAWADWDDGWAAYNRGDYATAFQEFYRMPSSVIQMPGPT